MGRDYTNAYRENFPKGHTHKLEAQPALLL